MDGMTLPVVPVVFHECPFSSLRWEGGALFAMHWLEASADTSIPLDVNWPAYEALEAAGLELCVAARQGGVLIGYAVYLLAPLMHYRQRIVADCDVFFMRESDRHGWAGVQLFREAERLLRARGVHDVYARVKLHVKPGRGRSDLSPLFRYLGYRPVEVIHRKRLDI